MPRISQKRSKANWARNLNKKQISRVGTLTGHPAKAYNEDGTMKEQVCDELEQLANKVLRIRKGRKIEGLRCVTPGEEVLCHDPFVHKYGTEEFLDPAGSLEGGWYREDEGYYH